MLLEHRVEESLLIDELVVNGWRVVFSKNTALKSYPLKKANARSIYSAIVEYCREKKIQLGRLIWMGFDGAATFSGDKTGVQRKLKELLLMHCLSTVTVMSFNWLLCKLLMLHQVSSMSTLHWRCYGFFHFFPKPAESLKKIQKVVYLPELKIVKRTTHAGLHMSIVAK